MRPIIARQTVVARQDQARVHMMPHEKPLNLTYSDVRSVGKAAGIFYSRGPEAAKPTSRVSDAEPIVTLMVSPSNFRT